MKMNEKDMELKEKLADLKDWQLSLLTEYCEDDMKKVKRIVNKCAKGLNLPYSDYDFLYGEAEDKLLESVVSFDSSKGAKFKTFLTGNIGRSVATWYRDNYQRSKRRNLAKDQNGKICIIDYVCHSDHFFFKRYHLTKLLYIILFQNADCFSPLVNEIHHNLHDCPNAQSYEKE